MISDDVISRRHIMWWWIAILFIAKYLFTKYCVLKLLHEIENFGSYVIGVTGTALKIKYYWEEKVSVEEKYWLGADDSYAVQKLFSIFT